MNRKNWEFETKDTAYYDNDANDFYYEWVDLRNNNLVELFDKWLKVDVNSDQKVKIKCGKGLLFIETINK